MGMVINGKTQESYVLLFKDMIEIEKPKKMNAPTFDHKDLDKNIKVNKDMVYNTRVIEQPYQDLLEVDWLNLDGLDIEHLNIDKILDEETLDTIRLEEKEDFLKNDDKKLLTKEEIAYLAKEIEALKQEEKDYVYIHAIKSKEPITLESLMLFNKKGSFPLSHMNYSDLEKERLLKQNQVEVNPSSLKALNKLLKYGEDVSKTAIAQIENLESVIEGLALPESETTYEAYTKTPLIKDKHVLYKDKDMQEIIDDLTAVTEEDLYNLHKAGKDISINTIREMLHKNTSKVLNTNKKIVAKQMVNSKEFNPQEAPLETDKTIEANKVLAIDLDKQVTLTQKDIQIIAKKLTVETAQRISAKMPLESSSLSKIAAELLKQENDGVENALKQVGLDVIEENKQLLLNIKNELELINNHKVILSVQETSTQIPLIKLGDFIQEYEANALIPEQKYGDSVEKIEESIKSFLKAENLPLTHNLIELSKGLLKNQLTLDKDLIEMSLPMLEKINTFLEEMTPLRIARFMKNYGSPLNFSIDELMVKISDEKLPKMKATLAEAILALEKNKEITSVQKEGLLGFYNILNALDHSKDEILGYLIKNNLKVTLENIDRARNYLGKQTVIDKHLDSSYGALDEMKENNNARTLILKAEEANEAFKKLSQQFAKEVVVMKEDQELNHFKSMLYPLLKKAFKKEFGNFEQKAMLSTDFQEMIKEVQNVSPEILKCLKEKNIPMTINNIYLAKQFMENPTAFEDLIKKTKLNDEWIPSSLDEIQSLIELSKKEEEEKALVAIHQEDLPTYRDGKEFVHVLEFEQYVLNEEGFYHIPFMLNGEMKMIDLFLPKKEDTKDYEKDGMKALLKYESKEYGDILVYFLVKEDAISYTISHQSDDFASDISLEEINLALGNLGYTIHKNSLESKIEHHYDTFEKECFMRGESLFEERI